ncbi:hypothetical protein L7F22_001605 [Adiantum nelumboides]|nr:hypothetical protein [Adiantum nelumboides]
MAGSGVPEVEYAQWVHQQEEIIEELGRALQSERGQGPSSLDDQTLSRAVQRAVQHSHRFYRLTRIQRNYNLGAWAGVSTVVKALMWMGSLQRPSTAVQLLYALMGHQIEAELEELLELGDADQDGRPSSLAALSAQQLSELDRLQASTVNEEDRIERETAKLQQSLADEPLLSRGEVMWAPASSMYDAVTNDGSSSTTADSRSALKQKLEALQDLCVQADALQSSTLERVLEVLHTTYQKGQYLLASAKLQVALRKVGQPPQ